MPSPGGFRRENDEKNPARRSGFENRSSIHSKVERKENSSDRFASSSKHQKLSKLEMRMKAQEKEYRRLKQEVENEYDYSDSTEKSGEEYLGEDGVAELFSDSFDDPSSFQPDSSENVAESSKRTSSEDYPEEINKNHPSIKNKKKTSSQGKQWIPANLMQRCCFSSDDGTLLSKAHCEQNLTNALKTKNGIDFYSMLQLGQTPQLLALAFSLFYLDKLTKMRSAPSAEQSIPASKAFDMEKAKVVDTVEVLPGEKKIKITNLITPSMCSNWVGKSAISKSIVSILDQINKRDPFFLLYSAPDSDRMTIYPNINAEFFNTFAKVLEAGFQIGSSSQSLVALASIVKSTTRNFIEKRRSMGLHNSSHSLEEFVKKLDEDASFRASECSVEHMPEQAKSRLALKRGRTSEPTNKSEGVVVTINDSDHSDKMMTWISVKKEPQDVVESSINNNSINETKYVQERSDGSIKNYAQRSGRKNDENDASTSIQSITIKSQETGSRIDITETRSHRLQGSTKQVSPRRSPPYAPVKNRRATRKDTKPKE